MSDELRQAIRFAAIAHACQWYEREVVPYIVHPLRVAMAAATEEERIVAVLHDVAEDSSFDLATIEAQDFATPQIMAALDAITRRDGESYRDYIDRACLNDLARRVKILDVLDNRAHCEPGHSLIKRYDAALMQLERP